MELPWGIQWLLALLGGGLLASCAHQADDPALEATGAVDSASRRMFAPSPHSGDTPPASLALQIAYPQAPSPPQPTAEAELEATIDPPQVDADLPAVTAVDDPRPRRRLFGRRPREERDDKDSPSGNGAATSGESLRVRTTAYCRDEGDHFTFGSMSAMGKPLRLGAVRSAAADWSRFPAGTRFRIVGAGDEIYEIDDYGSALVGTSTIDLYQPDDFAMEDWGAREVEIEVLRWGSRSRSLAILRPRAGTPHIDAMITALEREASGSG